MKRSFSVLAGVTILSVVGSGILAAQSQTQSLGDYARAVKKTKNPPANTPPKVYDNDNLPTTTSISVVGDTKSDDSDQKKDHSEDRDKAKNADGTAKQDEESKDKKPELKPGQSAEERQKALNAWKDTLAAQKDKIGLLSRELDVLEREHRLKASEFYANTARRTQNPNGFESEDAKYKQQIADKQKQLDDAKTKLGTMEDEARKSGAPNSITE